MRFKSLGMIAVSAFLFAISAYSQDVIVPLVPSDGTDATMVNWQIRADTTASGGVQDTHVYELQRDQYYFQNALFTVPPGKTLRLRAASGPGKKPIVYLWATGTGANPTRPAGNNFVLNGGNLIMENICYSGYYEYVPDNVDLVQGGLINTTGVGSSIILDGVVFSNVNGQHVRTGVNAVKVKITNSIFANMGALETSNLGAGKGIDLREATVDSFIVVNNTFVNFQDRAIRHYNFKDPAAGTGNIQYGLIEHNTFVNGMGYHGLLSLGNVGPEIIIKDNLFVDAFALGADSTDGERQAEWANTGEFYADGSRRITWIFTAPNDVTQWTVGYNYYAISDSGQAFLDDYGFPAGSPLSWHINSRLGADSANAFTQTDLSLANIPRLMTNMMRWYETPAAEGGAGKKKDQTNFVKARDDYDRRMIEFYRDTLDASYPTWSDAYVGADMGFPVGDLNWFPDVKAIWEQGTAPSQELVVVNPSFELPGTAKIKGWDGPGSCSDASWAGATDDIPGWSADTPSFDSGVEKGTATDGVWTAFMKSGDPQVWQTLNRRIQAGETLLLQVDARNTWQATVFEMELYYLDAGARVAAAIDTFVITSSNQTFNLLFKTDDVPAAIGKPIGIGIRNVSPNASSWIGLDFVRLVLVTNEIIVDGNKDPFYELLTGPDDGHLHLRSFHYNANGKPANDADLSAQIWTAWDNDWFYLYEEVKDDTLSGNATNVWEEDELELKFDPQATDSVKNSIWETRLTALGKGTAGVVGADSLNAVADSLKQWARRIIPGGYALELAVKWSVIKNGTETITPAVGNVFGMAICQHDNDGAKRRQATEMWGAVMMDAVYNTPKYLASVKFADGNKLQLIPTNNMTGRTNALPYDGSDFIPTGVEEAPAVPRMFSLDQNYPNPFNPTTSITYSIATASHVRLTVYDVRGRQVEVLVDGKKAPGFYKVTFDGQRLASGIYFYRLEADSRVFKHKMVMLK